MGDDETIAASRESRLSTSDLPIGTFTPTLGEADVYGIALSPDGKTIYTSELDSRVRRALITNFGDRTRP